MCLGRVMLESENTSKVFPKQSSAGGRNRQETLAFPNIQEKEPLWVRQGDGDRK